MRSAHLILALYLIIQSCNLPATYHRQDLSHAWIETSAVNEYLGDKFRWLKTRDDSKTLLERIHHQLEQGDLKAFDIGHQALTFDSIQAMIPKEIKYTEYLDSPIGDVTGLTSVINGNLASWMYELKFESVLSISDDLSTFDMTVKRIWICERKYSEKGIFMGLLPRFYIEVNEGNTEISL